MVSFVASYDTKIPTVEIPIVIVRNIQQLGIKSNEWSFYCLILYLEAEGIKIPTQPELGKMIGLSVRQVKNIIANLKQKGFLDIDKNRDDNRYSFKGLLDKAIDIDSNYWVI